MKLRSYQVSIAPTAEPLSLGEAKLHLRVDGSDEDSLITSLITTAREYCETKTNRQFVTATYIGKMDGFRSDENIQLPKAPLQAVTGITYVDLNGNPGTVLTSVYTVDTSADPGEIRLSYIQYWPTFRQQPNSVSITFRAGYGDPADVPEGIKAAMKLLIGHLYANREAVNIGGSVAEVPFAVDALLASFTQPEVH